MPGHFLSQLPVSAFGVGYFEAGRANDFTDGLVHRKTSPFVIVAQCIAGRYDVSTSAGSWSAGEGEAFVVAAETPMRIVHNSGQNGPMSARWLHILVTLFGSINALTLLDLPPTFDRNSMEPFVPVMDEMLSIQGLPIDLTSQIRRQALAYRTFELICERAPLGLNAEAQFDKTRSLLPVLEYIRENLVEPFDVADLASQAALSPSRFYAVFKAAFGCSPMAYAHRQRLAAAWRLVMTGNMPLRAVAEETGFCNEFHLSRAFKAAYGYSPGIYRSKIYLGGEEADQG